MDIVHLLVFGFVNASVIALIAMGFGVTFGISKVANFAYGAVYILSALICWSLVAKAGLPYLVSIIISIAVSGFIGYALYWGVLYRLRGIMLNQVIASFAIGMAILQLLSWLGLRGYKYTLPRFAEGSVTIAGGVENHRLIVIGIALAMFVFYYWFTHHTRIGLSFRGMSQDEYTGIAVGIDPDKTAAMALAFGSALGAIASIAVLALGMIDIDKGFEALVIALAIAIVGGLESVPGLLLASLVLGFAQQTVVETVGSQWNMIVFLAAIIIILIAKPSGLLGKSKELEERV